MRCGQKTARPKIARQAGRKVSETSAATRTEIAIAGPKAERKSTPESESVIVAPAIISAAVATPAGARAVTSLAASTAEAPLRSRVRKPETKKTR